MNATQKKIVYTLLMAALFLSFYLLSRYIQYGSLTRNCNYTEEIIPIPQELAQGTIELIKPAYLTNNTEHACLPPNGSRSAEQMISELEYAQYYPTGITLNPPFSFKVVGIYEITKHGISTIDSGPGPHYFLKLTDENQHTYIISTESFGVNEGEQYLQLKDLNGDTYTLFPESFRDYDSPGMVFRFMKNPQLP